MDNEQPQPRQISDLTELETWRTISQYRAKLLEIQNRIILDMDESRQTAETIRQLEAHALTFAPVSG